MITLRKCYPFHLIIALCCISSIAFASPCSDSETVKTLKMLGNYRSALQTMGDCFKEVQKPLSFEDKIFFKHLMKQVLSIDNTTSLVEASENFQSVLENHPVLRELTPLFQFQSNFHEPEKQSTEKDNLLFSKVRQAEEQYYFTMIPVVFSLIQGESH
ncbi:secreted protein [Beggiatoa sp. PS]|nr:secreted protein [Beggiatoa sp. PS]